MKAGGFGGSNTRTGLDFEDKVDLIRAFDDLSDYIIDKQTDSSFAVLYQGREIGCIFKKHGLYRFLESKGVDWQTRIKKRLLPDNVLFNQLNQTLYIIEVKNQTGAGSVDEKLQTCDFKRKQYVKLIDKLNIDVEYIYVFNDWFNKPEYEDVFDYIKSESCKFYFNTIPLHKLSLPVSQS
jgi:hypothetical protein